MDFSYQIPPISMTSFPFPSHSRQKLKSRLHFSHRAISNFLPFPFPFGNSSETSVYLRRIIFFPQAAWPPTNIVRQIKESKQTNDQMNWQRAKKLNYSSVLIPVPIHRIPMPIPLPFSWLVVFPFPWESHWSHGIPVFSIPMHISNLDFL